MGAYVQARAGDMAGSKIIGGLKKEGERQYQEEEENEVEEEEGRERKLLEAALARDRLRMAYARECVAVCCSVLQCVAVCCSLLRGVTVCCSVFSNMKVASVIVGCLEVLSNEISLHRI